MVFVLCVSNNQLKSWMEERPVSFTYICTLIVDSRAVACEQVQVWYLVVSLDSSPHTVSCAAGLHLMACTLQWLWGWNVDTNHCAYTYCSLHQWNAKNVLKPCTNVISSVGINITSGTHCKEKCCVSWFCSTQRATANGRPECLYKPSSSRISYIPGVRDVSAALGSQVLCTLCLCLVTYHIPSLIARLSP